MGKRKVKVTQELPKEPKADRSKFWVLGFLLALSVFIFVLRTRTYSEPFERDLTSHAVIAHELLQGRELYSDLWDSKPPAIFLTYAAAEAIVGYGPQQMFLIGVAAAIVTMLGCYKVGEYFGGKAGGVWTAAFWAILCSDLWLWANQPNIEVGMNACLIWAFALMLRADIERIQWGRWIGIGALFALATLYKTVAITFPFFLGIAYVLCYVRDKKNLFHAVMHIAITAAVGAAMWGLVFAYFALTDRGGVFYDTMVTYARYYSESRGGNMLENLGKGLQWEHYSRKMKSTPVIAVLGLAGVVAGLCIRGKRRMWMLTLGFLLAAYFAIALPGRFYNHYFQLWLCPLVVAAGGAVSLLLANEKINAKAIGHIVAVVAIVITAVIVLPQYKLSPDEWSVNKQGPQYIMVREITKELDAKLKDDEGLYVLGINPGFYFWSKKSPPTGVIWSPDMANNPLAEAHTIRALEDLERAQPKMVVINRLHLQIPQKHPVLSWIAQNYQPISGNPLRGKWGGQPLFLVMEHKVVRQMQEQ